MVTGNLAATGAAAIAAAFPRRTFGQWPTPLERAEALARHLGLGELWIKRDDRSAEPYGGHKVRALEFLLGALPPQGSVFTVGGLGSTHCLATAVYARRAGLTPVVAQFPQPATPIATAIGDAIARWAEVSARARWPATFPLAFARAAWHAWRRGPVHWIPPGASSPLGTVGYVHAGLELAQQMDEVGGTPPDAIVVPLGSGGTAAGLAVAVEWLGWPTTVVAVRVAQALVANRWRVLSLARRTANLLVRQGAVPRPPAPAPARVRVVTTELGRGYGHPTARGDVMTQAARDLAGLVLDPTYTAKALAGLEAVVVARQGQFRRVVFWHTFSARLPGG
jgi:D-cysteine desulfhydrase